jgi:hypothetical protein
MSCPMSNRTLRASLRASSGGGGAGLRPAGADAGPSFGAKRDPRMRMPLLRTGKGRA